MIPELPSLSRSRSSRPPIRGLFDEDHPAPDAVLLSHAHLDHAGLLHLSRPTAQRGLDRSRFREVVTRQPVQIGDCRVTPLAVDHSIYGSVAYLIEGDGKTVLYSQATSVTTAASQA